MAEGFIATASTTIDAPAAVVWDAFVNPETIKRYMFGSEVTADWKEGGAISWKGEWQGTSYEDKGTILAFEPLRMLRYTHYSPLSGLPDEPESYHTVTVELTEEAGGTRVTLTQDNNATEEAKEHSERNWAMMLEGLKTVVVEG